MKPIGGFFEAFQPQPTRSLSVLNAWAGARPWSAFQNARSAMAALADRFEGRVWIPAYLCEDAVAGIAAHRLRLYALDDDFEPDLSELDPVDGDVAVVVSYFGRPIAAAACQMVRDRPGVTWVEDRAQALDAGDGADMAWRLYSPRKLLGVADGGILAAPALGREPPRPDRPGDVEAMWTPCRMRAKDPAGADSAVWHAANQAKEQGMAVTKAAMTPGSIELLAATAVGPLIEARHGNWRRLDARLHRWSAFRESQAAPLGYVLKLAPADRETTLQALHAQRLFAAIHWRQTVGSDVHGWSDRLLTLPCDHRYGAVEMDRIAEVVEQALA